MLQLWLVALFLLSQDSVPERDGVRLSLKAAPSFGEETLDWKFRISCPACAVRCPSAPSTDPSAR